MRSGKLLCVFLAVAFVVFVLIVASNDRSSREARLRKIEQARSLTSVVARHESSPVVQVISKAMGTNVRDYLKNRVADQEKMASKSGDLVSLTLWAPGLHSLSAKMNFFAPSLPMGLWALHPRYLEKASIHFAGFPIGIRPR